jgi:hypothetical protein
MQRLNRTGHGPRSAAFFLFLGLAILPISLRAAGFQVSFNPSLSAAVDAWQQLADVFGAGYQPGRTLDLSSPHGSSTAPLIANDSSTPSRTEPACAREIEQVALSLQDVSKARTPKAVTVRVVCPRAASHASAGAMSAEPGIAAAAIKLGFENHARVLEALGAIKAETATREELLKSIEKHMSEWSLETVKNLPIPQNLRVIVRMKPSAIPSAAKAAECKVRAALESAQRLERERAMLTTSPSTSPDYCEF